MTGLRKNRLKTIFIAFLLLTLNTAITWRSEARHISNSEIYSTLTSDTIPRGRTDTAAPQRNAATTNQADTLQPRIDTFSLRLSKDTLDAPVDYEAEDSAVLLVKDKRFILYGKAKINHKDIVLTAPKVELDQQTNVLTAYGETDSLGTVTTRAVFTQGEQSFQSELIRYNFKSGRGLTQNTITQQEELYIHGSTIKRANATTVFISDGKLTTCNLDEPHFHFKARRVKVIHNKVAVTGYVQLAFEDVPIPKPLGLPFGFFPLNQGRRSGLLPAQFTANEDFGLGLEGLGYHHVFNQYLDVTVRANVYSYGGWLANITPQYRKRYRYNGSFNIGLQHTKIHFKGDPDFQNPKTYSLAWNHSVDRNARPGTTFSANVNISSTRYNELLSNSFTQNYQNRNFQNMMQSSIAYSKTFNVRGGKFDGHPINLQLNAGHDQNNNLRLINLRLPEGSLSITTIFPFEKQDRIGAKRWYENLGIGYNSSFRSQISFFDTGRISVSQLIDTLQWGARHNVPITMSLPPIAGGKLLVSPNISYEEVWLQSRMRRAWNPASRKVDTLSMNRGFFTDRQMSFGLGMNTAVFGTFFTRKQTGVTAIRHVVRPNVSANYRPNLSKSKYDLIQVDTTGRRVPLPQLFGGYGYGEFGGLTFGIDNNLEMKYRGRKDTTVRLIRLIDGFSINSGYNFLADSLQLQQFNMAFRSTLFEKINITGQAVLDPYNVDTMGFRVNRFMWDGGRFRLPRFTGGSISLSTNFRSKPRDPSKPAVGNRLGMDLRGEDPSSLDDQLRMEEYMRRNPAEFVDFNIPWSFDISYSLVFGRQFNPARRQFESSITSSASFNSSFSLTPKWNFTTSGFYDFTTMDLTSLNLSISRDMHCWQLSVSVVPLGLFRSFNIAINPKAAILQDLKVNRTRVFSNY